MSLFSVSSATTIDISRTRRCTNSVVSTRRLGTKSQLSELNVSPTGDNMNSDSTNQVELSDSTGCQDHKLLCLFLERPGGSSFPTFTLATFRNSLPLALLFLYLSLPLHSLCFSYLETYFRNEEYMCKLD